MAYLLDANVLIRAHEDYYPVDRIPQYWAWLLERAAANIIKMPRRIFDEVTRAAKIRARAQDVTGKTFELDLEGLAAVCLQHEMDHLEGKLFVDYLSDLKRERIRKKLDKDRKERVTRERDSASARAY